MRGGGRAEGSPKGGKLALVKHISSPPLLCWIPTRATRQSYRDGRAYCWLEVTQNRRFKNPNLQGVMMKSKTFKKRAIIIVSVRKDHTHTRLLAPSSRTAAAGAVTTGSSDLGKFPPHPLFHPKALNLPEAGLFLASLSASRRETAAQAMADSFPRGRLTLSPLKYTVLSFPGVVYLPGFCHTHICPPSAHLREHAVSTLDQWMANLRSCSKSVPVLLPTTLLFLGPHSPQ